MPTSTVATNVQRSWAAIVKGNAVADECGAIQNSWPSLKPASRGSLLCFCRGEVLTMLANYGWLMVYGDIKHPCANKHDGHVYVHKCDVTEGSLAPGDVVTFYLYVDEKGLGAESCCLEKPATSGFNPDAAEFMPATPPEENGANWKMRVDAEEFVPNASWSHGNAVMQERLPSDFATQEPEEQYTQVFTRLAQVFAVDDVESDSDDESSCISKLDDAYTSSEETVDMKIHGCKPSYKVKRAASPDGSTSAGTTSDSEGESSCDSFPMVSNPVPRKLLPKFRPPPGLNLDHFRPPPGLIFPGVGDDDQFIVATMYD
jgi:hypothetical protein